MDIPVVGWIQNAEPGYPGTEPWAGRATVKSQGALRLLGVSTSSPRGVQAQLYRFSSAFTICSTNIPSYARSCSGIPTLHWAVISLQSPPACGSASQPHLCGTLLNLRWTWDIASRRQGSSLRLLRSRHRSNRKGREGLLMAKDRECREAQRMNVKQRIKTVTGHHYRSRPVKAVKTPTPFSEDCSRETSHQPVFAEWVFNTTKDQGMLSTI